LNLKAFAKIELTYDNEKAARVILDSISPDNISDKLLKISSHISGNKVIIAVECTKSIGSFLSTLDDLLFNIQAAGRTLEKI